MSTLKLSDLFIQRGHTFNGTVRLEDQSKLCDRLKEHESLRNDALYLEDFSDGTVVPYFFLELFLEKITTKCTRERIDIV